MISEQGAERDSQRTEQGTLRDLDCLAESAQGEMHQTALTLFLRVQEVHEQRCAASGSGARTKRRHMRMSAKRTP